MTNWTPARSIFLSQLLDKVVGTEEMIKIRQNFCRIYDSILSAGNYHMYFTGSKAEGLDLPNSDDDFMLDINNKDDILVIQSLQDATGATHRNVFLMSTENVPQCFAMLKCVRWLENRELLDACQYIDSFLYLRSYLYVHNFESKYQKEFPRDTFSIQGPSIEEWTQFMDKSKSGTDKVLSIHCQFWPNVAREWPSRQRHFAWPSARSIRTILDFGVHVVPVGHPQSEMKMMEWRISFSVAERTLVWSFNHVQLQCYAVMKLILKEYINVHCSPPCRVLCSYFIKTFLF